MRTKAELEVVAARISKKLFGMTTWEAVVESDRILSEIGWDDVVAVQTQYAIGVTPKVSLVRGVVLVNGSNQ